MARMSIIARTARLTIRTWTPGDAPALLAIYSDPDVTRFIPHVHLTTLEQAEQRIQDMSEYDPTLWAVEDTALVGVCGFRHGEAELGFAFARSAWGKGYAREAAEACLRIGERRGMRRIVAQTREANAASRRVLDRLGFVECGRDGEWCIYERLTAKGAL